ncbi:amino acid permease [Enterococcus lactis]|uniref:APC family permease n=1 Tax=Enterococcus TaxID=1350 RepID=UPI000CF11BD6|nr:MULTISPECIES: amino acid permease [Enterococcus]EGP4827821.1 amino acid permease [Enterococcus faecium]EGP5481461.1 amino acid permease [Enterococcus faecium]EGP5497780.1 amino acid permease [Enterococcus faecium]EME7148156.1 amino acid permease [Enterococcus faecium]EME7194335.1 amino acid permease [Enterococcus faecium]
MKGKLKREINLFGALATVMGTVIGAGVFFKTAAVTASTQSTSLTLLAWLLGGFLTICAGLTVAELATAIPETGGAVKYIEAAYGKLPSFLLGWAQSLIYFPANIAALSIIFATQLTNLLQLSTDYLLLIAVITAVSVTGLNLLGTKVGASVQSVTLIVKLIPIAVIVVWGLLTPGQGTVQLFPIEAGKEVTFVEGLSSALLATLFAYDGWLGVGAMAGELKRPEKDLPKAIILGLSFVTVVYLLINFVFLKTLPIDHLAGNLNAASEASDVIFGEIGGKLVTIGILISVYGALNGYTLTGIRVPYAMALEDELPFSKQLTKLSKKFTVPYVPAIFQLAVACIMMSLGSFDFLTDMLIFVMWLFSLLIFIGVFILRKKAPELPRPYKVPLYPIVPIIAILGAIFILGMTMMTQTKLALIGIGVTLIGIPVYYQKKKKRSEE